ncbi:hypothetical protein DK880_00467 [Candidatus Cardinium hertigii]|uniref:Uncharacterized protein n=1 Tax=Candidatus Cardinium hertigii TaxID=247481 RepID=A0A2Z3LC99_9BACT|nr:hypothetical protein DK880_00467 [Candidatus Cardinium hertigii]
MDILMLTYTLSTLGIFKTKPYRGKEAKAIFCL